TLIFCRRGASACGLQGREAPIQVLYGIHEQIEIVFGEEMPGLESMQPFDGLGLPSHILSSRATVAGYLSGTLKRLRSATPGLRGVTRVRRWRAHARTASNAWTPFYPSTQ